MKTNYQRQIKFNTLIALFIFSMSSFVTAYATSPEAIIQTAANKLLVTINQETATFDVNPQRMYHKITQQLRPIADVAAIARGVMGSYYKTANANQRARFVTAFEKSLVKIYTDSLMKVKVKSFDVKVTSATSPNSRKISIPVTVTSHNGSRHQVSYSLIRNKQNIWKIRNIVADGVNFGLTYRNQFKSEMRRSGNQMDQVIANWATAVAKR